MEDHSKVIEYHSMLYPLIIAGSLILGAKMGPTLFQGAAIGVGAAALIMHHYDITKLIGDVIKSEDL